MCKGPWQFTLLPCHAMRTWDGIFLQIAKMFYCSMARMVLQGDRAVNCQHSFRFDFGGGGSRCGVNIVVKLTNCGSGASSPDRLRQGHLPRST